MERLADRDVRPVTLDVADLEEHGYVLYGRELRVGKREVGVELVANSRGWIRRLAPPKWRPGVVGGSRDGAVRTAWAALMVGSPETPPSTG